MQKADGCVCQVQFILFSTEKLSLMGLLVSAISFSLYMMPAGIGMGTAASLLVPSLGAH